MLLRTFEGTHYEIGYRLGRGLATLDIPESDSQGPEFAVRCEAIVKEIYPPILEKVEGLIEGALGLPPDAVPGGAQRGDA